jgi:ATP-binding cassette subfamily B protein
MIQGMQELKLNSGEKLKRWEWENLQASLFKIQFRNLSYSQTQQAGALLINEGKNIAITFIAAQMVLEGKLTFGAMLAVQYIIGQLNSPVEQFIGFMQTAQDAKISLERLNEIHGLKEEEQIVDGGGDGGGGIKYLPENSSILLKEVSFTYPGSDRLVLQNINLEIPFGKTTAIVGVSGSGKTTLLKLLLKFYEQYKGDILINGNKDTDHEIQFKYISPSYWRMQCGAVLQDGFIFNDSIAKNIAVGDEEPDLDKLIAASRVANILPFVEELANGFYTKIGTNGVGISQGQKQRLLIARAVYKNPHFLFLDEATNSLDTNNEKVIVENLQKFLLGKTVLVVAHRLSTVKNADKIIVLHDGMIAEEGTHSELTLLKGKYFELVKNQLDLGG